MICSFACPHCGERNSEVQFAGRLPDFGVEILFRCLHPEDLNRELIRSEFCTILLEELDMEIAPKKAEITNIESLLRRTYEDLAADQPHRKLEDEKRYAELEGFLKKVESFANGQAFPLTLKLRDPSGNSNIKNPFAPRIDKQMEVGYFRRTMEELKHMGYNTTQAEEDVRIEQERELEISGNKLNFSEPFNEDDLMRHEAVGFDVPCEACFAPGQMKTCRVSVPFFEDLVIMSFSCSECGHHTTETKSSGEIGKQCLIITLNADTPADLKRDLFKSETCFVSIPEIELELDYGTLGGVLTTVEGLLEKIHDHLSDHNPFGDHEGDSDNEYVTRMRNFLNTILEMRGGSRPFTLILVDPLARSFLQNPYLPADDHNARRELRDRTYDEDEMLGLNDMKVENYN